MTMVAAKKTAKKAPAKKVAKKAAARSTSTEVAAPVKASARAMTNFMEKFEKRHGKGTIEKAQVRAYRVVSTGSMALDDAMGCGGWVVGRISEVWGPESVSKTTLMMIAIANFQREFPHRMAALINMERTFDAEWARKNGVDIERLYITKPGSSEDVSGMARDLVESKMFSIVVLDSVGGMITNEEMVNDAEKASVGTAAKVITRMVKQCAVLCDDTDTTLIIVNQVRAILSAQGGDTTGGGKALKHVTTHKIRLKRTGDDPFYVGTNDDREQVGFVVGAVVEKNKVAPPRRVANFALFNQPTAEYGPIGIDKAREALTIGLRLGIVEEVSTGRFLLPGEEKPIHGAGKTRDFLREHPDLLDTVWRRMIAARSEEVKQVVEIDTVEGDTDDTEAGPVNTTTGEILAAPLVAPGAPTPPAVTEDDDEDKPLDFSGRTTQADGNYRALDEMRDDARIEAAAAAR